MIKRHHLIIATIFCIFSFALIPITASANRMCEGAGEDNPYICGHSGTNEEDELMNTVANILNTVYTWVGILAVIFIVVGGIKYMTSAGSPERIKSSKNTIIYSIVGLVITVAAFAITNFIIGAINGNVTADDPSTPTPPAGTSGEDIPIKSLQISGVSTLRIGSEYGFTAKIIPDYATDRSLDWTSTNPEIATVDKTTGRVTAVAPGVTNIIVTATSNALEAVKTVTVTKPVEAESVSIINKQISIVKGKSLQLYATVLPHEAENKKLTWATTNRKVVAITKKGRISGVNTGRATISVATKNGKQDSFTIIVRPATTAGTQQVSNDRVSVLQSWVKKMAKPKYASGGSDYAMLKDEYAKAYLEAANKVDKRIAGWGDGKSCCGFVDTLMRISGWDDKFPIASPKSIYANYFHGKGSKRWEDVTDKIKSNSDAKPGDVIITNAGSEYGHILVFVGKIEGFSNVMASASHYKRYPMADNVKNINKYARSSNYYIFRLKDS